MKTVGIRVRGQHLRELREGQGDTQVSLAVKAGLSPDAVARLERDAKRFSYADSTYVQKYVVPAREDRGITTLLVELGALTAEYRTIKEALQKPSQLPRAVRQRRKELRRDARLTYWRRARFIDTTVYRLLEADPETSDDEIEEGRESYDRAAADIRRAVA